MGNIIGMQCVQEKRLHHLIKESLTLAPKIANSKRDPIDREMSEMTGRTAECRHTRQISTKSGKSLMNAFLRARTAFGFEYLISFRAEHNDADRDITGIEELLFRIRLNGGEKIVSKIQSWRNK